MKQDEIHDLECEAMWIHDFNHQTTWSGTEVYNSLAEALFCHR